MIKRLFSCVCDQHIRKILKHLNIGVVTIKMKENADQTYIKDYDVKTLINKKVDTIIDINNDLIYNKENKIKIKK